MSRDSIRRRVEAATPGPWGWAWDSGELMVGRAGDESGEGHVLTVRICDACEKRSAPCVGGSPEDQAFIAHARTDIPLLLAVADAAARVEAATTCLHDGDDEDASDCPWPALATALAALEAER